MVSPLAQGYSIVFHLKATRAKRISAADTAHPNNSPHRYPSSSWKESWKLKVTNQTELSWLNYVESQYSNEAAQLEAAWPFWDEYGGFSSYISPPALQDKLYNYRLWHPRSRPVTILGEARFMEASKLLFGQGDSVVSSQFTIRAFTCKQYLAVDMGSSVWVKGPSSSQTVAYSAAPRLSLDFALSGVPEYLVNFIPPPRDATWPTRQASTIPFSL